MIPMSKIWYCGAAAALAAVATHALRKEILMSVRMTDYVRLD
jgi:hypothetical protein